ncbi:disease resistance protein Roq1-like [Actinidia eriantha]|uniref:disease resistance protein Roq1-like n=1 Tax=Actinidia eriantha TaxID=165200 RepID=UPI0025902D6D|nr:disease resistance protein Roq1-like [Actinidia eriantha]
MNTGNVLRNYVLAAPIIKLVSSYLSYEGLLPTDRSMIDAASGGALVDKTPEAARNLIANMAANSQQFGTRLDPPSKHVNEKGSLLEAFAKHKEHFKDGSDGKTEKWRETPTEGANLSSWDLQNVINGNEAKFIEKIVEEVETKLNLVDLIFADCPVGIESRLQKLTRLLYKEADDIRIVAIWGIGRSRTTIAKAAYNLTLSKFEGSSILADVRESSNQPNGLVLLQKKLISIS